MEYEQTVIHLFCYPIFFLSTLYRECENRNKNIARRFYRVSNFYYNWSITPTCSKFVAGYFCVRGSGENGSSVTHIAAEICRIVVRECYGTHVGSDRPRCTWAGEHVYQLSIACRSTVVPSYATETETRSGEALVLGRDRFAGTG